MATENDPNDPQVTPDEDPNAPRAGDPGSPGMDEQGNAPETQGDPDPVPTTTDPDAPDARSLYDNIISMYDSTWGGTQQQLNAQFAAQQRFAGEAAGRMGGGVGGAFTQASRAALGTSQANLAAAKQKHVLGKVGLMENQANAIMDSWFKEQEQNIARYGAETGRQAADTAQYAAEDAAARGWASAAQTDAALRLEAAGINVQAYQAEIEAQYKEDLIAAEKEGNAIKKMEIQQQMVTSLFNALLNDPDVTFDDVMSILGPVMSGEVSLEEFFGGYTPADDGGPPSVNERDDLFNSVISAFPPETLDAIGPEMAREKTEGWYAAAQQGGAAWESAQNEMIQYGLGSYITEIRDMAEREVSGGGGEEGGGVEIDQGTVAQAAAQFQLPGMTQAEGEEFLAEWGPKLLDDATSDAAITELQKYLTDEQIGELYNMLRGDADEEEDPPITVSADGN